MKKIFLFLFILASSTSCMMATFDRYPGEKLNSIPPHLQGTYKPAYAKKEQQQNDSSVFHIGADYWEVVRPDRVRKHSLGDSNVLSIYKGHYFLSRKNETGKYWYVNFITPDKEHLHIQTAFAELNGRNVTDKFFERINDPSDTLTYHYKMNEEKLLKYYRKKLKKHNWVVVKKVNP